MLALEAGSMVGAAWTLAYVKVVGSAADVEDWIAASVDAEMV